MVLIHRHLVLHGIVLRLALLMAGPKDKLDSTVISQPAIYVASLAAVEKLRQTEGEV